jgi:hypothetical protein
MKTKPKTAPVTLASLQAAADKLRALDALTQSYWEREQIPPQAMLDARNDQQAKLADQLLPLMETLAAGGFLSVNVWTGTFAENLTAEADNQKRKYISWRAFDVVPNGGIVLQCYGHCEGNSLPPPTLAELMDTRPAPTQN